MMPRIALVSAFVFVSFTSAALAQDAHPHRGACRADAEKLCAGIEHGGGRILNCLAAQKDKLSDDCRKSVEAAANKTRSEGASPRTQQDARR